MLAKVPIISGEQIAATVKKPSELTNCVARVPVTLMEYLRKNEYIRSLALFGTE